MASAPISRDGLVPIILTQDLSVSHREHLVRKKKNKRRKSSPPSWLLPPMLNSGSRAAVVGPLQWLECRKACLAELLEQLHRVALLLVTSPEASGQQTLFSPKCISAEES